MITHRKFSNNFTNKTDSGYGRQSESVPNKAYNFSEPVICKILSSAEVMMINSEWPEGGRLFKRRSHCDPDPLPLRLLHLTLLFPPDSFNLIKRPFTIAI